MTADSKHIVFILSSLGDMGGAIRVSTSLANRLVEDYRVSVIQMESAEEFAFELNPRVATYSLDLEGMRMRKRLLRATKPLDKILQEIQPDIALCVSNDDALPAFRALNRAGIPMVFCDHGALINQIDERYATGLRKWWAKRVAATVVLTEQSKDDYCRIFGLSEDRVVCIPNWIPPRLVEQGERADAQAKRILWAGRLDAEKGPDLMLDIAKRVLPSHPDWTWDVYGKAVLGTGADYEAQAREVGIGGQLRFCGTYDDPVAVYASHSIGTLTSYREGLPLFLLEAQAFGMPCLSFDVDTGPRDIMAEGENGFLVEPYDCAAYAAKLAELMDDEDLRVRMGQRARENAARFSLKAIYPLWTALIESVCARGKAQA